MKLDRTIQDNLTRKINRQLELEAGRVNYNRVFQNKKKYSRKKNKEMLNNFDW